MKHATKAQRQSPSGSFVVDCTRQIVALRPEALSFCTRCRAVGIGVVVACTIFVSFLRRLRRVTARGAKRRELYFGSVLVHPNGSGTTQQRPGNRGHDLMDTGSVSVRWRACTYRICPFLRSQVVSLYGGAFDPQYCSWRVCLLVCERPGERPRHADHLPSAGAGPRLPVPVSTNVCQDGGPAGRGVASHLLWHRARFRP